VHELKPEVVCIDSPSGWAREGKSRRSEIELRRLGITAFSTPTDPGDHPFYRWMRVGFSIYQALSPTFSICDGSSIVGSSAEVFPEATAVLLAGRLRNKEESKRNFRGQVLRENGVDADNLPTVDRLDAALAALTGVLALGGEATYLGDPAEGVILLPVATLPPAKLVRSKNDAGGARRRPLRAVSEKNHVATKESAKLCECGCGALVRRRFLPGHDAKLRSKLLQEEALGASASRRLAELGWSN